MITPQQQSKRQSRIDRERDEETNNVRTEFVRHHRINRDEETNNPNLIAESVTKKRKAKDNNQEINKIKMTDTVTTTENESRTEQSLHDDKNGEDSKQNHDVQKGLESPILH